MTASRFLTTPGLTAETGKRFYDKLYCDEYEPLYAGKYLSIDVETGKAGLGNTLSEAVAEAKKLSPDGFFFTLRIGYPTAVIYRR